MLNWADRHGITLIPAHTPSHLDAEAEYLLQERLVLEWHLHHCIALAAFHLWGQ